MKKDFKLSLPSIILAAVIAFVAIAFVSSLLSILLKIHALMIVGIVFAVLGTFACIWGSNIGLKTSDTLSRVCIIGFFVCAVNVLLLLYAICFVF